MFSEAPAAFSGWSTIGAVMTTASPGGAAFTVIVRVPVAVFVAGSKPRLPGPLIVAGTLPSMPGNTV